MFKRQVTEESFIERYVTLCNRVENIANQACEAAGRPDLYAAIMQANSGLVAVAANVGLQREEIAPLLLKLRLAMRDACLAGNRPDLYEPLVQINLQLVQTALDIAQLRSRDRPRLERGSWWTVSKRTGREFRRRQPSQI